MPAVRVIVAGDGSAHARDLLERAGIRVVAEAEDEDKAIVLAAERSASAIVYAGALGSPCGSTVPTIVLGDDADLASAASLGAFGVMPATCSDAQLAVAVEVAISRWRDLAAAHEEADALRDQLETRKLVERAKGILMTRLGLNEADAYRRLQKASQDENRKMRDIADSIVRTEKILALANEPSSDKDEPGRSAG